LLTPEERDSGLSEIRSAGNAAISLATHSGEIFSELGTTSFIAGARRVVVVYDLKDFYDPKPGRGKEPAKKAKAPASDPFPYFADWMRNILPTTENVVIFVCNEADEKGRKLDENSPIAKLCGSLGTVIVKRDKPLQYEFEDAVLAGNARRALTLLAEWIDRGGSDPTARGRIFSTLSNLTEVAMECRCHEEARRNNIAIAQVSVPDIYPSFAKVAAQGFKTKKYQNLAARLSMEDLPDLAQTLAKLQASMWPTGEERVVRDWQTEAEMIVMRLTRVEM